MLCECYLHLLGRQVFSTDEDHFFVYSYSNFRLSIWEGYCQVRKENAGQQSQRPVLGFQSDEGRVYFALINN